MKILNLYAGLGGNRKLWGNEHEVTAVEIDKKISTIYKSNFPNDTVLNEDAHEFLRLNHQDFDFIWTSPPCQSHSKMAKFTRHKLNNYPDLRLYEQIIFLQNFFKGKFVVENVKPYYEPLIKPTKEIGRHLFWSNFVINDFEAPKQPTDFINSTTTKGSEELKKWLGINYDGNVYYKNNHCPGQVLRNCVHPEIGLNILNQLKQP